MVLRKNNFHSETHPSLQGRPLFPSGNTTLQFRILSFIKRRFAARSLLAFFRDYSATIVVTICVIAVALINFSLTKEVQGSFFDTLGIGPKEDGSLKNKISLQNQRKNNLATAPLAGPGYVLDENISQEEYYEDYSAFYKSPTIQSQIILASYSPIVPGGNGREAKTYIVKDGDTVGLIAARHGVSANTILWANDLSDTSVIKPGNKLTVLPVTGIRYKVQKSDSLDAIVNKFNSDKQKVLAFNEIPADESLKSGQELILPDGYISAPTPAPAATGTQLATAYRSSSYGHASATSSYRVDSRPEAAIAFPMDIAPGTWLKENTFPGEGTPDPGSSTPAPPEKQPAERPRQEPLS